METSRTLNEIEEALNAVDVNTANEYGETIIHILIKKNITDIAYFDLLHRKNFNFNATNDYGETPLIFATRRDNTAICLWLLQIPSIEINVCDEHKDTALLWATHNDNFEVVRTLIEKGASVEHCYKDGKNAVMWAAFKGNDVFYYLLDYLSNHNHEDNFGVNLKNLCPNLTFRNALSDWIFRNKISVIRYFFKDNRPVEKNLLHKIFEYYTE